jgi:AcrR family transcriptional regulator
MAMPDTAPSSRSDAKANRERLLTVARDALAKDPAASLNSIAKAASVGPGTLYRHFPTREALVVAVYRAEIENLIALSRALTEQSPPIDAFRSWCFRLIEHVRRQRGFAELLQAAMSEQERADAYRPVIDAIDHLLKACEDAGAIPGPSDPGDIQLLLSFIWQIRTDEGERRARRVVDLIIRGLMATPDKAG